MFSRPLGVCCSGNDFRLLQDLLDPDKYDVDLMPKESSNTSVKITLDASLFQILNVASNNYFLIVAANPKYLMFINCWLYSMTFRMSNGKLLTFQCGLDL